MIGLIKGRRPCGVPISSHFFIIVLFKHFCLCLQDTLVTLVQHALAAVYEDRYPYSNKVQQGLEKILNQRYDGSREVFTNKFVRPTISLLDRLKTKVSFKRLNSAVCVYQMHYQFAYHETMQGLEFTIKTFSQNCGLKQSF